MDEPQKPIPPELRAAAVFREHARWQVVDRSGSPARGPLEDEFAREERWLETVGRGEDLPLVHLWRHEKALVLGYRDTRLPRWAEAAGALRAEGYEVPVRLSGGTAVPLDAGVLNVSLVYPARSLRVEDGFDAMYALLRAALAGLGLRAARGLVPGGYCPGDSDVAVGGRKVAGISQRRRRLASLVHAFVLVEGEGASRARLAARFYALAAPGVDAGPPGKGPYPEVRPEAVQSLSEAAGRPVRVRELAGAIAALLTPP